MRSLSATWRAGPPEVVILGGAAAGFVANVAALAIALAVQSRDAWPSTVAVFGAGMGLALLAGLVLSQRASRTSRNFVFVGAVATGLAVLSIPGLIGGATVLFGASWGIVQTYAPRA